MKEFFVQLDERTYLHCCVWLPAGMPKAVVQIIHGVAEHAARYDSLGRFLADHGILVVGEDHPGHGKSVGEGDCYGYLNGGWENVLKGIHLLYEKTKQENPDVPYFMLGHSMGSFLLRTYLFTYEAKLRGAMISGTGWQPKALVSAGLEMCALEEKRLGERSSSDLLQNLIFNSYNKKFAPNRTPYDWVSSDEAVVDAYAKDPMCTFRPTIQLCREMLRGIAQNQKLSNLEKMDKDLPVYFFAGAQDPVGGMGKGVERSAKAFRKAGMKQVECRIYPGMRHETHNEIGRETVYADILRWVENHAENP